RSAWIFASQKTGSFSSLACIWVGDSSGGFGPVLLLTSPAGVQGRGIFSSSIPSASDTAPVRTRSQSSSVFGSCLTTPAFVVSHHTASKMLSETGSIMYFINSLTDTTGVIGSPIRDPRPEVGCLVLADGFSADRLQLVVETTTSMAPTRRRVCRIR